MSIRLILLQMQMNIELARFLGLATLPGKPNGNTKNEQLWGIIRYLYFISTVYVHYGSCGFLEKYISVNNFEQILAFHRNVQRGGGLLNPS